MIIPLAQEKPPPGALPGLEDENLEDSLSSSSSSLSDYISEDILDSDEIAREIGVWTGSEASDWEFGPLIRPPRPARGKPGPRARAPEPGAAGASSMDDFRPPRGAREIKILRDFENAGLVQNNLNDQKNPMKINKKGAKPKNINNTKKVSGGGSRGGKSRKSSEALGTARPKPAQGDTKKGQGPSRQDPKDRPPVVSSGRPLPENNCKKPLLASSPPPRKKKLPLPITFMDQALEFGEEVIKKGLLWESEDDESSNQSCHSGPDLSLAKRAFSSFNERGLFKHLLGTDKEGLTIYNDEWLGELNKGMHDPKNPFGDTYDISETTMLEISIRTAKKLPPDKYWGDEDAPEYNHKPCRICKKAAKYNLLPAPAPRLTPKSYKKLRLSPPDLPGDQRTDNSCKFVFSGPSRVETFTRSGRRCTQLDLSQAPPSPSAGEQGPPSANQERPGTPPPLPSGSGGRQPTPMPPPPPPRGEGLAARPGESSDLGSGSDRPVDLRDARRSKAEGARGRRQTKKKVKKSPGKKMQEAQADRFTGFKTNAKGKGKAGVAGGKPAYARGASGGASRTRSDLEEGELSSPELDLTDYEDVTSGEEASRHNTTPNSPSVLLGAGSPAPYAALAAYGGHQGDMSALEPRSPSRGQGRASSALGGARILTTPSPDPVPFRRSPNGPNQMRYPDYMRTHHHSTPPGLLGVPEASFFSQEFLAQNGGEPGEPGARLGTGRPQGDEEEVDLNVSGDLTQGRPDPGRFPGISPIRGPPTPTRDENTPPDPTLQEQTERLNRSQRIMEEIRRAEAMLTIQDTPIRSLAEHPDINSVINTARALDRSSPTDALGAAMAASGITTPARGEGAVNIQVNIHAPQQVVNASPSYQISSHRHVTINQGEGGRTAPPSPHYQPPSPDYAAYPVGRGGGASLPPSRGASLPRHHLGSPLPPTTRPTRSPPLRPPAGRPWRSWSRTRTWRSTHKKGGGPLNKGATSPVS